MAYEGPQICIPGLVAGADLSAVANQYKLVKMSADKTIVLCAALTDKPIGVLQNTPGLNQAANVCAIGVTKIQGDEDLDIGDLLKTSADGQAAVLTPGTDTTHYSIGQVILGNSAAGGYATALVNCANLGRGA